MSFNDLTDIFSKGIGTARIGIIGDFCVDIYWHADMTRSELSRETPHYPLPVINERMSLGAAGNVAANISALHPGSIRAISVYGDDWRGKALLDLLEKAGIDTSCFVLCRERFTNAYCKPMRHGISEVVYEDPRLDFENYEPISAEAEERIIENLYSVIGEVDILCVSDQFRYGVVTEKVRNEINKLAENGYKIVVDSRYNIGKYSHCILKPNEVECWRAVYGNEGYLNADTNEFICAADALAQKNSSSVFCTLGEKGSYVTDGSAHFRIAARKVEGPVDICGAGDTSLSAFACAVSAGLTMKEAAEFAGLASGVTVRKIGQTGTASLEEIINSFS